jgi:hypothetical protein
MSEGYTALAKQRLESRETILNAELRTLTEWTRKLREELRALVSPPEHSTRHLADRSSKRDTALDSNPARRK